MVCMPCVQVMAFFSGMPFKVSCLTGLQWGKKLCEKASGSLRMTLIARFAFPPILSRNYFSLHILAIPGQGIAAGVFAGPVRALESANTYVNLHLTSHPTAQIPGQIPPITHLISTTTP